MVGWVGGWVGGWVIGWVGGMSGNVVEQEAISTRGFPSGNEVNLTVKVKAASKQPNPPLSEGGF